MFTAIIISAVTLLVSVSIHLFNISVLADRVIAYHDRVWSKTPVLVFIAISSQLLLAVVCFWTWATLSSRQAQAIFSIFR